MIGGHGKVQAREKPRGLGCVRLDQIGSLWDHVNNAAQSNWLLISF